MRFEVACYEVHFGVELERWAAGRTDIGLFRRFEEYRSRILGIIGIRGVRIERAYECQSYQRDSDYLLQTTIHAAEYKD